MSISIFSPIHVNNIEDIYMANYQARFFNFLKTNFDIDGYITIDKDSTGKFDELFVNISSTVIDLRDKNPTGIVNPTKNVINLIGNKTSHMLRVTMDTQIPKDDIIDFINVYKDVGDVIVGCKDICSNINGYLEELNLETIKTYDFVQGNFIFSSMNMWKTHYINLPKSIKHYCDDSVFTYMVENISNVKPIFIKDFWKHNRTKNIYYLESLYA